MAAIIKLHNSNVANPPKNDKTKPAKNANVETNPTSRSIETTWKAALRTRPPSRVETKGTTIADRSPVLSKNASTATDLRFDISA